MIEAVKLETEEGIARLTLNRPKAFNAFDIEMITILGDMLTRAAKDPSITGVVITGQGKAFCTGGDLRWIRSMGTSYGSAFHLLAAKYHQAILEIRRMPKPVVAAINGIAAGGGFSMALACDFRIMEVSAVLKQGYTSNGLSIDGGGTFTLPRLVGMAKAMEIAAFDLTISAEKALSWGLVTEVVNDGEAIQRALALVREIVRAPLSSFAASKKLITDSLSTPFEAQLEKERELLAWCADHADGHEGVSAFLEKRKPRYNLA